MRKIILAFSALAIPVSFCLAQSIVTKVQSYSFSTDRLASEVVLHMPYASSEIEKIEGDTALLHKAGVIMIEIVCTDYPTHLSLSELNQKRVDAFYKMFPFITKQQVKNLTIYRQLKGASKNKAENMFHGVVIKFRPRQDKETMEHDITKLLDLITPLAASPPVQLDSGILEKNDEEIHPMEKNALLIPDTLPLKEIEKESTVVRPMMLVWGITSEVIKNFKKRPEDFRDADSMQVMTSIEAFKKGYLSKESYKDYYKYEKITVFFKKFTDTIYLSDKTDWNWDFSDSNSTYKTLPDSTIFKIFKRNTWKNTAIVADVTGSMYPYSAQLILWLKLNSLDNLTSNFSFFNDGDHKADEDKILGETKGIYNKVCRSFEEVKELMLHTMQSGGGGDAPENNIEALLKTEEEYPDIDYTILVADNWANIKDKVLILKLKKPVRVILCGVENDLVNTDYLNLARKTGGSLHLMEEDLMNLAALHEGEEIKIGSRKFKIVKGDFIEINQL